MSTPSEFDPDYQDLPSETEAPSSSGAAGTALTNTHVTTAQPTEKKGAAATWAALIIGALILILLLVFVIQNNQTVGITYFGWSFNLPLGVALLLAAIGGVLVAGLIGSVRIIQLNHRLKKIRTMTYT